MAEGRAADDLQAAAAALFAAEGRPQPGDDLVAARLAARASDRMQAAVATAFAAEGSPRPEDPALGQAIALEAADPLPARVAALFEGEAAPRPGDGAVAARLASAALAAAPSGRPVPRAAGTAPAAAATPRVPAPARRRPSGRGLRLLASPLALLIVVSSAAAASTLVATRRYWAPKIFALRAPAPPPPAARERPARRPKRPTVTPMAAGPAAGAPPAPAPPEAAAAPPSAPAAAPGRPRAASAAGPADSGAPELFSRANRLRRQGELAQAADAYRALQRQHPRSHEALLSHLSLADLHLQAGKRAAALAELDAYLLAAPDGQLVEEALYRKARTLYDVGRASEARGVWRTLLDRFPQSLYREEARRVLSGAR